MADTSSVDVILDFLRRNHFTRAEAALRSELSKRPDLNGFLKKLNLEDKELGKVLDEENGKPGTDRLVFGSQNSFEVSNELIIKEIECGTSRNESESKWRNSALAGEWSSKPNEATGTMASEDSVLDLYSWNFNARNGHSSDPYQNDGGNTDNCSSRAIAKSGEEVIFSGESRGLWPGSTSTANAKAEANYERILTSESKELDQQLKTPVVYPAENTWSRSEGTSTAATWNDCPVKTVLPFPKGEVSISYDVNTGLEKREGKKKANIGDVRVAIKEQVDEVGRALYFGKSQGNTDQKNLSDLSFSLASDNQREEFPRLPPVKLKSEDKPLNINWQENFERDGPVVKHSSTDNTFLIGSYLDVPVGQEINSSGQLLWFFVF